MKVITEYDEIKGTNPKIKVELSKENEIVVHESINDELITNNDGNVKVIPKIEEELFNEDSKTNPHDDEEYSVKEENIEQDVSTIHEDTAELFKCNFCDYSASQNNCLTSHLKSIHSKTKYKCDYCDHKTSTNYYLKHHISSVHFGIKIINLGINSQSVNIKPGKGVIKNHINAVHFGIKTQM
ncbi:hypothetical protein HHI36_020518 [Cryptolaemus montrouzieri]|uniref:C2H2-type domain-containing protein n=1 Tax=Cryptolaemus montrouzieri TaxID=559131 RepID=A0ABD2NAH8_9CUCU